MSPNVLAVAMPFINAYVLNFVTSRGIVIWIGVLSHGELGKTLRKSEKHSTHKIESN